MSGATKPFQDPEDLDNPDDEDFEIVYEPEADDEHGVVAVKNKHEKRIMAIPGVQGVGVTKNQIGDDAIAVYVKEKAVIGTLPKSLDGYEVETVVVGEIDAL